MEQKHLTIEAKNAVEAAHENTNLAANYWKNRANYLCEENENECLGGTSLYLQVLRYKQHY